MEKGAKCVRALIDIAALNGIAARNGARRKVVFACHKAQGIEFTWLSHSLMVQ